MPTGDAATMRFSTGAVRSADGNELDFTSAPLLGFLGVLRTAHEGATKYGANNYRLGIPAHVCVNRAFRHLLMHTLGDRSEQHLSHAAWNCMVAEESMALFPELNAPHQLGPGATVPPEMRAHLEAGKADREEKRRKGLFAKLGDWTFSTIAEVARLLKQRRAVLQPGQEGMEKKGGQNPPNASSERPPAPGGSCPSKPGMAIAHAGEGYVAGQVHTLPRND